MVSQSYVETSLHTFSISICGTVLTQLENSNLITAMKIIIVVLVLLITGTIADDETKAADSKEKSAENEEDKEKSAQEATETTATETVVRDAVTESESVRAGEKNKDESRVERATPKELDLDDGEFRSGDSTTTAYEERAADESAEKSGEKSAEASEDAKVRRPEKESDVGLKSAESKETRTSEEAEGTAEDKSASDSKKANSEESSLEESQEKTGASDKVSSLTDDREVVEIPSSRRMLNHDILETKGASAGFEAATEEEVSVRSGGNDFREVTPNPGVLDSRRLPTPPSIPRPALNPQLARPSLFFNKVIPIPLPLIKYPTLESLKQLPRPFLMTQKPIEVFQNNFKANEYPFQNSFDPYQNTFPVQQSFTPPTQRPLPPQPLPLPLPKTYLTPTKLPQSNYDSLFLKLAQATEAPRLIENLQQFPLNRPFQPAFSIPSYLKYKP